MKREIQYQNYTRLLSFVKNQLGEKLALSDVHVAGPYRYQLPQRIKPEEVTTGNKISDLSSS